MPSPKKKSSRSPARPAPARFPIVGIGASAGGLEAFTELLKHLPRDTGMGFVLVQHLDPKHESALTQILGRATSMPVRPVTNNVRVAANRVYVIPPNTELTIEHGVLKLQPRRPSRTPTRSIDSFFESLAQDQRELAIGVVLSGTATDGTMGLEAIKAEGGITFAQDDSAKYDSMPRSAVAAGGVDFVLSPKKIAEEFSRIAKHPFVARAPEAGWRGHAGLVAERGLHDAPTAPGDRDTPAQADERRRRPTKATRAAGTAAGPRIHRGPEASAFRKILLLVRNESGVDFGLYKINTIERRIQRRMILKQIHTVEAYTQFLRGNPAELAALYADLLIGVTGFFRNPEAFDFLQRKVFPRILPERRGDPLRMWVLGCSTGQEAYSLAMAFTEFADHTLRAPKLQIFASDLNSASLDKARSGLYAKTLVADVSPQRLRRFFVEEDGGFRVIKPLREAIVFARQNILSDPPFSRMHLISCRNLMIYLEPNLQKKILPTFHYALKPQGCLFLGASESIGTFTHLFEPLDRKHKIFARKAGSSHPFPIQVVHSEPSAPKSTPRTQPSVAPAASGEISAQREADRITRNRYAPPSVLVNAEFQITEFRGNTGPYLRSPAGRPNFNVLKMASEGLMLPLRAALNQAKKENRIVRREKISVIQNGNSRLTNFEVVPLKNVKERCYLIFFGPAAEGESRRALPVAPPPVGIEPLAEERTTPRNESRRIRALEVDLAETRDYAQSIQEQQEASLEEVQAANEEVTSANEELQSINEELETSKEELESSNEELTTVNEEMSHRNTELSRLNGDLVNLQNSTKLAILVLGRDQSIRRFSAQAEKQFKLLAADVGRSLNGVRHDLEIPDLEELIADVIASVRETEREVRDKEGRWYSLRVRPYLTLDNKIDGAVLVLVDITDLKRAQRETQAARDYAEATLRTSRSPLVVLRSDLRVNSANEAFYRTFQTGPAQTVGRSLFEVSGGAWEIPALRTLLEEILPRQGVFDDFEVAHDFPPLGRRTMLLNARRLDLDGGGTQPMILLAFEDVTERRRAEAALAQTHVQLQAHAEELARFNGEADRSELRVIELKKEINALHQRHGEPAPYPLELETEGKE